MRHLKEDADAVTRAAVRILARAVLEFFHNLERAIHRLAALDAVDADDRTDAAGVVLKARIVQSAAVQRPLLTNLLHMLIPLRGIWRRFAAQKQATALFAQRRCSAYDYLTSLAQTCQAIFESFSMEISVFTRIFL